MPAPLSAALLRKDHKDDVPEDGKYDRFPLLFQSCSSSLHPFREAFLPDLPELFFSQKGSVDPEEALPVNGQKVLRTYISSQVFPGSKLFRDKAYRCC